MPLAVLLVEDEPDVAQPIALAIAAAGHRVAVAADGREALLLVLGEQYDLILLDVRMPEMDGVTFLGITRSYLRLADIPVFLLTSFSPGDPRVYQAEQLGVQGVFYKSRFTLDELLAAIGGIAASA